ncbi:MAG: DNA replication/repair protein RecF [Deltaproteobacteria bacterium]|nr:DNA replication/repair protein RecF [Deltaproteobacteria bacterium]
MHLETLTTYNFRNLIDSTIILSPGINLFLGRNGQGKTNFLESIAILSSGRSFRTTRAADFIRWGERECSIFGKVNSDNGSHIQGVAFKKSEKEFFIDHEKVSLSKDYIGRLSIVTFTPADIQLVKGTPADRRRFIDKHMADIDSLYLQKLLAFQRAIKNKNSMLKTGGADHNKLAAWNQIIAETSRFITAARVELARELDGKVRELYQHFSGTASEVSVRLVSALTSSDGEPLTAEETAEKINQAATREIKFGVSLVGPHRDELQLTIHSKDARAFASQGESRSFVLSLKIAVIELIERRRRDTPIVLLDDVDAELDTGRKRALFELIGDGRRQVILSGTGESMQSTPQLGGGRLFTVQDGGSE